MLSGRFKPSLPLLVLALLTTACEAPSSPGDAGDRLPRVQVDPTSGSVPIVGTVALTPAGRGWSYAVDLDDDGEDDRAGELDEPVEIAFRFETHAVHPIRVTFAHPRAGTIRVVERIVAFDPDRVAGIRILARRLVPVPEGEAPAFEGIAAGPSGAVFAASYRRGSVYRLDPSSLAVVDSIEVGGGPEGMAGGPDGETLLVLDKRSGLSVLDPAPLRRRAFHGSTHGFYVAFLDAGSAIAGGDGRLDRLDLATGAAVATLHDAEGPIHEAGHFALDPSDGSIVVAGRGGTLRVADARTLAVQRVLEPDGMVHARALAFHPGGERLYAVDSRGAEGQRLLVLDPVSGELLSSQALARDTCLVYCVANPVATSRDGRWIVFAEVGRAWVLDTRTDRVALRIEEPLGSGVAASPDDDDVFYFVDGRGVVTRIRLRP